MVDDVTERNNGEDMEDKRGTASLLPLLELNEEEAAN